MGESVGFLPNGFEGILRKEKDAIQCESARAENGHNRNLSRSNRPPHISLHTRDISPEKNLQTFCIHRPNTSVQLIYQRYSKATRNQPILVLSNILEYIVLTLTCSHSPFILAIAFSSENSLLAELEISCNLSPSLWTPASRIKSIKTGTREWLWCNLKILKWWLMTWWAQIFMICNISLSHLSCYSESCQVHAWLQTQAPFIGKVV